MASIHADPRERNKRHYIAASTFNTVMKTYTTSMNMQTFNTVGTLANVTGATEANCPRGRILREVGVRLYPDAHPGISTMMVKVYDANSGLSGYIDPNAPQFAVFNSDKPIEIVDGGDNNDVSVPHKGQPVFTTGDIITSGGNITASTGDITATAGIIVSEPVYTTTGNGTITIDASSYSHAFITINGATTITVSNVSQGRTLDLLVLGGAGGPHALAFDATPIYAGNVFNRNLNTGSRYGIRLVAMNNSQMHVVGDAAY